MKSSQKTHSGQLRYLEFSTIYVFPIWKKNSSFLKKKKEILTISPDLPGMCYDTTRRHNAFSTQHILFVFQMTISNMVGDFSGNLVILNLI